MEVGIFAADPRAIASPKAKVVCVSLKLRVEIEAFVPLVIRAAKVLIPEKVVRQPAMCPQAIVSHRPRVSREHRRGHNGAKNSYRAQRFDHGHWFLLRAKPRGSTTMFIGTKTFFIFGAPEPLSQGVRYPRAFALGERAVTADIRPYAAPKKQQSEAQSEYLLHCQTPH